ncbi:MAG: hypothetical protein WBJ75_00210 [Pseudohongiellaceae bacterium]
MGNSIDSSIGSSIERTGLDASHASSDHRHWKAGFLTGASQIHTARIKRLWHVQHVVHSSLFILFQLSIPQSVQVPYRCRRESLLD